MVLKRVFYLKLEENEKLEMKWKAEKEALEEKRELKRKKRQKAEQRREGSGKRKAADKGSSRETESTNEIIMEHTRKEILERMTISNLRLQEDEYEGPPGGLYYRAVGTLLLFNVKNESNVEITQFKIQVFCHIDYSEKPIEITETIKMPFPPGKSIKREIMLRTPPERIKDFKVQVIEIER